MRLIQLSLSVALMVVAMAPADEPKPQRARGTIVSLEIDKHLVIRTENGKELTVHAGPKSSYTLSGKAGRFADLKRDHPVEVEYHVVDGRNVIETVDVRQPTDAAVELDGRIVRILDDNRVVVMTMDKKEVIVHVAPQTTFSFENKPAKFSELQTGAEVRVTYELRDNRPVAKSIVGRTIIRR